MCLYRAILKNLLLRNHSVRKARIYIVQNKVSSNHGPQGLGGAIIGKTVFTCVYVGNIFKTLLRNYQVRKVEIYMELPDIAQNQVEPFP
jgi:hypothetical protein